MGGKANYFLGLIGIVMFVYTKAENATLSPITSAPFCQDSGGKLRNPGDWWLVNPTTKCTCTDNNFVRCDLLPEPVCLDVSGKFRTNMEVWMNSSCVECACIDGSINCTRYEVNITYGLYKVDVLPTCEHCDIASQTALTLNACKAFRNNRAKLSKCLSGGFYIRDIHRCNGIDECPDGSDERGCENVKCKDEEGGTFLIKHENGWKVSKCLSCHCRGGQMTCKKTLTINFPGYFYGFHKVEQNCTQPSCKVLKFVRENREWCEGVELIKNGGIIFEGQTWKSGGCSFYFPGARTWKECPAMTKPICYVYNGAVCCASECPALQKMGEQMRGNLTFCPSGRQLESESSQCRDVNNCTRNFEIQDCLSAVTCQDEDSNQYFEGTTWSVGTCMKCACVRGKIQCSRTVVFVSFLQLTSSPVPRLASDQKFTEHCNQTECNVAKFMMLNKGVCNACRWNGKQYYHGDHWKENGVDFYCSSSDQRVRPGCYVENSKVSCTGAITGIRELLLISKDNLFLCDSGDEIISLGHRCNIKQDCNDFSDEMNCDKHYCPYEMAHGVLWTRTQVGAEVIKQCSLIDPSWTGKFSSNCTSIFYQTKWIHKTTCYCKKKVLAEHFERKISGVNETNFMNLSKELASSAQAKEFTNPRAFHDLFKELFHIVTSRLLTPLTHQNADAALDYCQHFISTVLGSPAYEINSTFCKSKLADDRNSLADKAREFLRQAPRNTSAYNEGWKPQPDRAKDYEQDDDYKHNFLPPPTSEVIIFRQELNLQLNIAPLVPAVVEKPAEKIINSKNNVTRKNDTNSNETRMMHKNVTNNQIKDLLRANNCTGLTFDEERGAFVYKTEISATLLKHENIQNNMELVLLCISIAAVALALILLTVLRLKNSERIFIHKSLLLSLGVGNLVYVLDKTLFATRQEDAVLCSAVAVIQYYLHTAVFTWMLVEGINLYIKVVKVFSFNRQYAAYVGVGWGIPVVIVGLIAAIRPSTFDMNKALTTDVTCGALKLTAGIERSRCWINGSLWIYKGPILVILLVNLMLFVILLRVIFGKISSKYGNSHVTAAKRGLKSTMALLPLLGVTWLVGFFLDLHYAVGYLFILLNSAQGVVFCIFHCVLDDQVQDAVQKLRARVRSLSSSNTRETPASNPNPTPMMKANPRVDNLQHSVDESTPSGGVAINSEKHYDETHL